MSDVKYIMKTDKRAKNLFKNQRVRKRNAFWRTKNGRKLVREMDLVIKLSGLERHSELYFRSFR